MQLISVELMKGGEILKYTTEEALAEVMHRSDGIMYQKRKHLNEVMSAAVIALFIALISVIAFLKGGSAETADVSVYGSFVLGKEAGGYILVALLAFILGVAVTILCQNYKKKKGDRGEKEED